MNDSDEFVREGDWLVRYERKAVTVPTDIKHIAEGAFRDSDVQKVIIGETVEDIGRECFCGCTKLTSISIAAGSDDSVVSLNEDSETVIGAYAFKGCSTLKTVAFGNNVISIGKGAFSGCTALDNIIFYGTKQQWEDITKGEDWDENTGNFLIRCNDGNITKRKPPEEPDPEQEKLRAEARAAAIEALRRAQEEKRLEAQAQAAAEDIIARIDRIYESGATREEIRSVALELQKQRKLPENRTPEMQIRLNAALGKLLKAMTNARS